jgi:hypothetical protein
MTNESGVNQADELSSDAAMDLAPGELPRWPRVVGTISIVWAALSLTCGGLGLVYFMAMPWLLKMAEDKLGPAPSVMYPAGPIWVVTGIGLIWSVLLLTAGVLTVRRNAGGRPLHLFWALSGCVLTGVSLYFNYKWQSGIAAWAAENPGSGWAKQAGGGRGMIGLAIGVVLGFWWPVFCAVWFGVFKTRADAMTRLDPGPGA